MTINSDTRLEVEGQQGSTVRAYVSFLRVSVGFLLWLSGDVEMSDRRHCS